MAKTKRTYNSTRRQAQARATQREIFTAAGRLFFERGYSGTTIEAIAQEAGVAVETVYANFGNKLAILSRFVDVSIVGDDEPVPLLQRPEIAAQRAVTDQRQVIAVFARQMYDIMLRMSPVFMLLRATAPEEAEVAALLKTLLTNRLGGMRVFVEQVARTGPLRKGLDIAGAAETVWVISGGEVFHMLTVDRGWSQEQYTRWLDNSLRRLLLP